MKISLFKSIISMLSALLAAGLFALGCGDDNEGKAVDSGPDVIAVNQVAPDTGPAVVDTGVHAPTAWPTTAEGCNDAVTAAGMASALNTCLCDNCVDSFGPCLVNATCMKNLNCAIKRGCDSATCPNDSECGPIIETGKSDDPAGVDNAVAVEQCQAINCAAAPSDSGT